MEALLKQINEAYEAFRTDSALQLEKNNKAAGTRARKASLELEKLMKERRPAGYCPGRRRFYNIAAIRAALWICIAWDCA